MEETVLLTEDEVAERLRCHKSKVARFRKRGLLPHIVGRPILIRLADLEAFIASQVVNPPSPEETRIAENEAIRERAARSFLKMSMRGETRPILAGSIWVYLNGTGDPTGSISTV